MRQGSKTLVAALVALLLAFGLAACGGDDDSDTTTTETAQEQNADGKGSAGANGDGGSDDGRAPGGQDESTPGEPAGSFKPKQHDDSGGGSEQFRVKGGDNSVQEFGEEASEGEFEAAAVALHNFLDARADGHWAAACEYLAGDITESLEKLAEQAKQIEATGCPTLLGKLTNPAAKQDLKKEARRANVGSLRVEGDRSFVIYRGLEGTILALPMKEEDGEWKVAGLAGTPLN